MNSFDPQFFPTDLLAEDLILYQGELKKNLSKILQFFSINVYFPETPPEDVFFKGYYRCHYLEEEKKAFLPLVYNNEFLGVLHLSGCEPASFFAVKDCLLSWLQLTLENLALQKSLEQDPLTGLMNKSALIGTLSREIELISQSIGPEPGAVDQPSPEYRAELGMITLGLNNMHRLDQSYGYMFGEQAIKHIAKSIQKVMPRESYAARICRGKFTLVLPGASTKKCLQVAEDILDKISEPIQHPGTSEKVKLNVSSGSSSYPQDFQGNRFQKPSREKAYIFLENSLQAFEASKKWCQKKNFKFADLLYKGGQIISQAKKNKVRTNLGSKAGTRQGFIFYVLDSEAALKADPKAVVPKAELMLTEIEPESSGAEIVYLNHPQCKIDSGDRLWLAATHTEEGLASIPPRPEPEQDPTKEMALDLFSFLKAWHKERAFYSEYVFALCQIQKKSMLESIHPEQRGLSQDLFELLRFILPNKSLICEFSPLSYFVFVPEKDRETGHELFAEIQKTCKSKLGLSLSIGLASYPCLNHSHYEILPNARKAYEHACMIQEEEIVCFNSATMTISADKCFNQGDIASALEEYQQALLMNPENTIARNSLGICYARLGFLEKADREFQAVLKQEPDNHMAMYNCGYLYHKISEFSQAKECYLSCLQYTPEKTFALIRLGQIAEQEGDLAQAKEYYQQAGESGLGPMFAYLYLSKLCIRQGEWERARELLHQALVNNPRDPEAMHLLAWLYLKNRENLQLAESLAQKSVSLRPFKIEYLELLQEILFKQDKKEEARALSLRENQA